MTNETIIVEKKNVYGNELIYPVCKKALILARMIGQKTFTYRNLESIKELGYDLELKQQTL